METFFRPRQIIRIVSYFCNTNIEYASVVRGGCSSAEIEKSIDEDYTTFTDRCIHDTRG